MDRRYASRDSQLSNDGNRLGRWPAFSSIHKLFQMDLLTPQRVTRVSRPFKPAMAFASPARMPCDHCLGNNGRYSECNMSGQAVRKVSRASVLRFWEIRHPDGVHSIDAPSFFRVMKRREHTLDVAAG